jgi:hypothetical protein
MFFENFSASFFPLCGFPAIIENGQTTSLLKVNRLIARVELIDVPDLRIFPYIVLGS